MTISFSAATTTGMRFCLLLLTALGAAPARVAAQGTKPLLTESDLGTIAALTMLEDRRSFDAPALETALRSTHPEVRRRAAQTLGRLAKKEGLPLLLSQAGDRDSSVTAAVVWAVGQLRDTSSVAWLDSVLTAARSQPTVRAEAATALGKLKSPAAGAALGRFLMGAVATPANQAAIGEALLAIGRIVPRAEVAPMLKWATSTNEELRWRATWALFRPKNPAAVGSLLQLSKDKSAEVRSWAVRGLTRALADSVQLGPTAEAVLLAATRDPDRRVQTEALRALASYGDTAAFAALRDATRSNDAWLAVTATEGLATLKTPASTAVLIGLTAAGHPCALRAVALQGLQSTPSPGNTRIAVQLASDSSTYCRGVALNIINRDANARVAGTEAYEAIRVLSTDRDQTIRYTALQALWTTQDAGIDPATRRSSRAPLLANADPVVRAAAIRSMGSWADSTDVPTLLNAYDRALLDSNTIAAVAAVMVLSNRPFQARMGGAIPAFLARFPAPNNPALRKDAERYLGTPARDAWASTAPPQRQLADYRAIVDRWVVPEYQGKPRPLTEWVTPRGTITMELFAGDAPLAMEELVRLTNLGALVGTQFTRVVADFVNQQETIRGAQTLRDEVNRRGLTRANLAWATAGLDTGAPGYTLGHTPQPHNEGDFTSLGRVIRGLDVMDRIQLGDQVTGARMIQGAAGKAGGN